MTRTTAPLPGPGPGRLVPGTRTAGAVAILAVTLAVVGWTAAAAQEAPASASDIPVDCVFPSRIGEVTFPHALHAREFEIECTSCHHEVNAKVLKSPHSEYFDDFWIRCNVCHHSQSETTTARKCSACHHRSNDIADQTLSAKVVTHKVCSKCHEIGTGATASSSCGTCHTGKRLPW